MQIKVSAYATALYLFGTARQLLRRVQRARRSEMKCVPVTVLLEREWALAAIFGNLGLKGQRSAAHYCCADLSPARPDGPAECRRARSIGPTCTPVPRTRS